MARPIHQPDPETDLPFSLTARELEVIRCMALGQSNEEIGKALHITVQTVKRHIYNLFDKMGMSNRVEVVMLAIQHGLVPSPSLPLNYKLLIAEITKFHNRMERDMAHSRILVQRLVNASRKKKEAL